MAEHGRYDLAFDIGRRILRIQCKWARRRGDVIIVNLTSSYLTKTREVRASYGIDEIDAVAVYCADLDTCYLLPVELVAEACYSAAREPSEKCADRGAKLGSRF